MTEQPEQVVEDIHAFWSKQPIVAVDQEDVAEGYIDQTIPVTNPPDKPVALPGNFVWTELDINDDAQLEEVYNFLAYHYVETDDHSMRFLYPPEFLRWTLVQPGYIPEWIFGVRTAKGTLVGFISGTPHNFRLNDEEQPWCTVNFLCVHSKLRSKNMATVLISEMARRVRLSHVYRAIFSGSGIPSKHFASVCYCHRPISVKRLSSCGFYPVPESKMTNALKMFQVPKLVHGDIRPMTEEDVPAVLELLEATSSSYKFTPTFTPELVAHMFLPRNGIVYSYVIPSSKGIQAFASFYMMDWTTLQENKGCVTSLKAAYLWYHASTFSNNTSLIKDVINLAANEAHADIINAFLGESADSLLECKFQRGDKELEFYSYNFAVPSMAGSDVRFFFR